MFVFFLCAYSGYPSRYSEAACGASRRRLLLLFLSEEVPPGRAGHGAENNNNNNIIIIRPLPEAGRCCLYCR